MSTTDLKIQNICDHVVTMEQVSVESDRVTIYPSLPIAATAILQVTRFGVDVPYCDFELHQDKQLLYGTQYLKIVLKEPDVYPGAIYELTYPTYSQYCLKCGGGGYADDFAEDSKGILATVTGTALLAQSVEKAIVTTLGSNKYHNWVGCGLSTLVGTKITDFTVLASEVESQVRISLENLKTAQKKHQSVNPYVSSDEVLGTILKVTCTQDSNDPTILYVYVQYTSQSGKGLDYTQVIELTQYRMR